MRAASKNGTPSVASVSQSMKRVASFRLPQKRSFSHSKGTVHTKFAYTVPVTAQEASFPLTLEEILLSQHGNGAYQICIHRSRHCSRNEFSADLKKVFSNRNGNGVYQMCIQHSRNCSEAKFPLSLEEILFPQPRGGGGVGNLS